MGDFEKYLNRAKNLAEEAGDMAKNIAGDVVNRAKELTEEGSKVRELTQKAKEQTSAVTLGAREKLQSVLQDNKAGKELRLGISQLEALPEIEGSIIYRMELETAVNYLNSLILIIGDGRLDDASVVEEIRRVRDKVQPSADLPEDAADEQLAIENVKTITYNACAKALECMNL